jgi:hypothetical protein
MIGNLHLVLVRQILTVAKPTHLSILFRKKMRILHGLHLAFYLAVPDHYFLLSAIHPFYR